MVGLLQSQFCTPPQKVDLLDGLMQMFRNKAALINIFYNYDNDVINWPVCQQFCFVYFIVCNRLFCFIWFLFCFFFCIVW